MDLSKFFDRVNHDRLMSRLSTRIRDKRVLKLIRRCLRAGVMDEGVAVETEEGAPQGGPLSPLLSNIVLDELDKEPEKRGLRFVRYADADLLQKSSGCRKGKGKYHQILNGETETQGERGKERRQQAVAAEISRVHIFSNVRTVKDSNSRQKHETLQRQGPGIDRSESRKEPAAGR